MEFVGSHVTITVASLHGITLHHGTSQPVNHVQVVKRELALECDYFYEAECQRRFKALIEQDADFPEYFKVPAVIEELSGKTVLTTEWVPGVHIDKVSYHSHLLGDHFGHPCQS